MTAPRCPARALCEDGRPPSPLPGLKLPWPTAFNRIGPHVEIFFRCNEFQARVLRGFRKIFRRRGSSRSCFSRPSGSLIIHCVCTVFFSAATLRRAPRGAPEFFSFSFSLAEKNSREKKIKYLRRRMPGSRQSCAHWRTGSREGCFVLLAIVGQVDPRAEHSQMPGYMSELGLSDARSRPPIQAEGDDVDECFAD